MIRSIVLSFLLLLSVSLSAQWKRAANWYFGEYAGLKFNTGSPVADTFGKIYSIEGTATISDTSGNLLFYTDGMQIFDRRHLPMPDGSGIDGFVSVLQSAMIIPDPASGSKYYLVTPNTFDPNATTLKYSVIDMTLNGGFGNVITGQKNIPLLTGVGEDLSATMHCNAKDYWFVTRILDKDSLVFKCYLVDNNGINTSTTSKFSVKRNPSSAHARYVGHSVFSTDGTLFAFSSFETNTFLFDFDKETGMLSLKDSISTLPDTVYSTAFSPDKSKLYASSWKTGSYCYVSQYDLNAANITASRVRLDSISYKVADGNGYGYAGRLQLGPDQRIYSSRWKPVPNEFPSFALDSLDVILFPDKPGTTAGYTRNHIYLQGRSSTFSLPNFVSNFLSPKRLVKACHCKYYSVAATASHTQACQGDTIQLFAADFEDGMYEWNGPGFYSTLRNPEFTDPPATGLVKYFVLVNTPECTVRDTVEIDIAPRSPMPETTDITYCQFDETKQLVANGINLKWYGPNSHGLPVAPIPASDPWGKTDWYVTQNTNGCESHKAKLTVDILKAPSAAFSVSEHACVGDTLDLRPFFDYGSQYEWSFGDARILDTTPHYFVISWDKPGEKEIALKVTAGYGCKNRNALKTYVHDLPISGIEGPPIREACSNREIILSATNSDKNYRYDWQAYQHFYDNTDGTVTARVLYSDSIYLTVTNEWGCKSYDNMYVLAKPCCEVFLPDAFTPNNDGINDIFRILTNGSHAVDAFRIMNRWGQVVFETNDETKGWDGYYKGKAQEIGSYVYFIKYRCSDGSVITKKGDLMLIR